MPYSSVHIVIPIFDGVTQLDFTGPLQVFSYVPSAHVVVASLGGRDINADGLVFSVLADLRGVEICDVLCVPGGSGTNAAMLDENFMGEIRRLAGLAKYHTSVCTGSFILAAAGLLRGKRATTHWASLDSLKPFGAIVEKERVVRDGNLITGGGVTAGIDFGLVAVSEIFGRDVAESAQLGLEYAPAPPFNTGHPRDAPPALVSRLREASSAEFSRRASAVEESVRRLGAV